MSPVNSFPLQDSRPSSKSIVKRELGLLLSTHSLEEREGRERGKEGRREGGREEEIDGGREGGREGGKDILYALAHFLLQSLKYLYGRKVSLQDNVQLETFVLTPTGNRRKKRKKKKIVIFSLLHSLPPIHITDNQTTKTNKNST